VSTPSPPRRSRTTELAAEAAVWVLFALLLVPAGFVGYVIGRHDADEGTTTVTVAATTAPETTAATTGETTTAETTTEETTTEETTTNEETTTQAGGGGGGGNASLIAQGQQVFSENCAVCHGPTGQGGSGGPDLRTAPKAQQVNSAIEQVTNGGGGMPPFGGQLSDTQIRAVATYVVERIANK
jgi:cytochrome c551